MLKILPSDKDGSPNAAMTLLPPKERYYPVSAYYKRRFGCRVYKVSVSVAETCPNRAGINGAGVCVFCDEWGSAAYHRTAHLGLSEQFQKNSEQIRTHYKPDQFLVYFQAYTNTFARIGQLESQFEEALAQRDVIGLVVGTRPDCLPGGMMALLSRIAKRSYLSVELGLQTLDEEQLRFLSRGHDVACSLAALEKLSAYPDIDVCVHLMFGLPGETDEQLRATAHHLSIRGVHGVKLHNLHVLRDTPLADMYTRGEFSPVTQEDYARKVGVFLENLSPNVVVHRLNAVANRWDDIVAPDWARSKMGTTQMIRDYLKKIDTWQGKFYPGLSKVQSVAGSLEKVMVEGGS